jgi:hypothetical protein
MESIPVINVNGTEPSTKNSENRELSFRSLSAVACLDVDGQFNYEDGNDCLSGTRITLIHSCTLNVSLEVGQEPLDYYFTDDA